MKDCYGTIFPDMSQFRFGKQMPGRVFQVKIETLGPGHRNVHLDVSDAGWQECVRCEEYGSCYDFSMAKIALGETVSRI